MAGRSIFSPFSDVLALAMQPVTLICLALMIGAQLIGNAAIAAVSGPFPLGGHGMVPIVHMAVTALKYGVFVGVFFILSRKLGGLKGQAGQPDLIVWLGLMVLYLAVTRLASMIPALLPDIGQMGPRRLPATLSAISFAVRLLFYPIMIFIAAAVHHRGLIKFSAPLQFLTSRGWNWLLCYVLFGLVFAAALFIMPLGMGTASGVPPRGGLFVIALVGMCGQLLGILFAVAAYRAMRAAKA